MSLTIFKVLAQHEDNHDTLLRSGVLAYLLNDTSHELMEDRKLGRIISDVVHRIASFARRSYTREQTFIAQGAIDYVRRRLCLPNHLHLPLCCVAASFTPPHVIRWRNS
jgi:hypothetical protein